MKQGDELLQSRVDRMLAGRVVARRRAEHVVVHLGGEWNISLSASASMRAIELCARFHPRLACLYEVDDTTTFIVRSSRHRFTSTASFLAHAISHADADVLEDLRHDPSSDGYEGVVTRLITYLDHCGWSSPATVATARRRDAGDDASCCCDGAGCRCVGLPTGVSRHRRRRGHVEHPRAWPRSANTWRAPCDNTPNMSPYASSLCTRKRAELQAHSALRFGGFYLVRFF